MELKQILERELRLARGDQRSFNIEHTGSLVEIQSQEDSLIDDINLLMNPPKRRVMKVVTYYETFY